jgi:hypothetical protein
VGYVIAFIGTTYHEIINQIWTTTTSNNDKLEKTTAKVTFELFAGSPSFLSCRLSFNDLIGKMKVSRETISITNAVTTLVHIGLGSIDSRMIMDPNMKVTTFTNANSGVSIRVIMANTNGDFEIFISSYFFQESLTSQRT